MKYEDTNLPKEVNKYLTEIYNNEELRNAFYDCDIEIYGLEWIKDLENDTSWFQDIMGLG